MRNPILLLCSGLAFVIFSAGCLSPEDARQSPEGIRIERSGSPSHRDSESRPSIATPSLPDPSQEAPPIAVGLGEPANIDVAIESGHQLARSRETCLARGHALDSGFYGHAEYRVQVAPDGSVLEVTVTSSTALSPAVIECVRLAMLERIYPAPGGSGMIRQEILAEP